MSVEKIRCYKVYALVKDKKCVYVGCTFNLDGRLKTHKVTKDFDECVTIEHFNNKKDALACERAIIKYLSMFGENDILNGRYAKQSIKGQMRGFINLIDYSCKAG